MRDDQILDKPIQDPGIKHARLSFKMLLWTVSFFCLALVISQLSALWLLGLPSLWVDILFSLPTLAMMITGVGGFRHAIFSMINREPWVYQKVIGFLGGLVFVLLGILVIYSYVLDYIAYYS
ncbi:MAG: hypothetical protein DWQ02_03555 [Bacteroidetes bacterium]|nr:MAG: hypothetical protein DWQ02_03555 [Bacteroidota bacterium]